MMERSEPVSPPAHLSAGWGLNLTARRRKRMFCCRLLRLITPFLALGGRNWPNAAGARSIGLLTAMPWLEPGWPGWLEMPERDAATTGAEEPLMRQPAPATPAITSQPGRTSSQQPEGLVSRAGKRNRVTTQPERVPSQQPAQPLMALALVSPFSRKLRVPELSSKTPLAPVVNLLRTKRVHLNVYTGSFPQPRIFLQNLSPHSGLAKLADKMPVPGTRAMDKQVNAGTKGEEAAAGTLLVSGRPYGSMPPVFPDKTPLRDSPGSFRGHTHSVRALGAAPNTGSPAGFRGLTTGTLPVAFYLPVIPAAPGRRSGQTELLFQNPPQAGDRKEMPPLSDPGLHGGPSTFGTGPVSLQGLSLVMETIRHTMKRQVAEAIREREVAKSIASNRAKAIDMTTAENHVSDNLVRLFMQKMQKLAEEERFRLGLLR